MGSPRKNNAPRASLKVKVEGYYGEARKSTETRYFGFEMYIHHAMFHQTFKGRVTRKNEVREQGAAENIGTFCPLNYF